MSKFSSSWGLKWLIACCTPQSSHMLMPWVPLPSPHFLSYIFKIEHPPICLAASCWTKSSTNVLHWGGSLSQTPVCLGGGCECACGRSSLSVSEVWNQHTWFQLKCNPICFFTGNLLIGFRMPKLDCLCYKNICSINVVYLYVYFTDILSNIQTHPGHISFAGLKLGYWILN